MSYQHISFSTEGPIAIITLNRPQRRNALSLELMTGAHRLLEPDRPRTHFPRGDPGGCGKGVLLRPRPERDGGARHQRLSPAVRRLHRADDARSSPSRNR